MNGRKKPRRIRWPANPDSIRLAVLNAARLTAEEMAGLLEPLERSCTSMRQGTGTAQDWSHLATACAIALTIEELGVVRGLKGHLQTIDAALQSIAGRCDTPKGWQRTPLYFNEIDALSDLGFLHRHQLQHLSAAEFKRAVDLTTARIRQAEAAEPIRAAA